MGDILFLNIGWMNKYSGLWKQADKIVGGGKWVNKTGHGHEVCNFLACKDGYIYGHVETSKINEKDGVTIDRDIKVLGENEYYDGVDVVWTATHPTDGGRRVVGWYRNARVYRKRQTFSRPPSLQHKKDKIIEYRVRCLSSDAHLIDHDSRNIKLGHGKGWMGQTPWKVFPENNSPDVQKFLDEVRRALNGGAPTAADIQGRGGRGENSPSAANNPYSRYVAAYEAIISPRHSELQKRFKGFLERNGVESVEDKASVDIRFNAKK